MLTLKLLHDLGYSDAIEHPTEIFEIPNFMTDDEIKFVMDFVETLSQEDWETEYNNNLILFSQRKFGRSDVDNLVAEGKLEVTSNWNDKVIRVPMDLNRELTRRLSIVFEGFPEVTVNGAGLLQRQYKGIPLVPHVDNHTDPSLVYAAVFYINDDYEGGEIYFDRLGVELKPKPKTLLIFPTGEDHFHGVREVGEGSTRFVIPSFVGQKDFYVNNKF
jgi:hypothetical protein